MPLRSFSSVQFSRSVVSDSLRPHESQHARPPCPSPTPGVHSDSPPSSQWCHPAISSSVIPFFSCPQSLPASKSFPMSQLFAWHGQSTGASALASFLAKKSQGGSPSEWTGWISLQSKGLSRVFSNTRSLFKLMSIESVMPSSHLILCRPLLLLPPISPSIKVFSNESTLHMRWPKYWSFSFSIIPCKEIPGLISFRMDWLDFLVVFSNTTVQTHQFFGAQLSSQSNSHIHTWPLEKQ